MRPVGVAALNAPARVQGVDLARGLAVLGMLDRLPVDNIPVMVPSGKSELFLSMALESIGSAIGEARDTLDVQKGAAVSEPDVIVEVPGEDTVSTLPSKPAGDDEFDFEIEADE